MYQHNRRNSRGVLLLSILWLAASPVWGATFTVNSTGDAGDATPGDSICATAAATCTLRAAIQEANAFAGVHLIDFNIPLSDLGYNPGTGVFTIGIGATIPISRAGTVIDGTTQAVNQTDTNPGMLGVGGTVGVGPDGKPSTGDEIALSRVAAPEIQVQDGASVAIGLQITANSVTIRGLAMLGFGTNNGEAAIVISAGVTGTTIEQNVLGSTADSFTAPAASGLRGQSGIESLGGAGGNIRNNLSGFHRARGIWLNSGSSGWTVSDNEVRDNGVLDSTDGDGIALNGTSNSNITGNLLIGSTSQGFVSSGAGTNNNTFVNNTVTGNGVGTASSVAQSAGITFRGSAGVANTTLERNVIQANYGAGLQINDGATAVRLIRNSIADNGTIVARDTSGPTGQIGIDLNSSSDNNNFGTFPFVSLNDPADGDSGGNDRLNYPILETATLAGGNFTLTGWSRPDALIELFLAAPDGSGFGEGQTWVATFTEGVADADAGVTAYSGPINGIDQGADTTNRFSFTVPAPAGISAGSELTATGTDPVTQQSSEFSGLVTVLSATISGTVFEDVNGDGDLADKVAASAVRVRLYRDLNDNGTVDAGDVFLQEQNTDAGGDYSFTVSIGASDDLYLVAVDSKTVPPSAGGAGPDVWAEQTYGDDPGTSALDLGVRIGGRTVGTSDDVDPASTAPADNEYQHLARLDASVSGASGVDFAFSFQVISHQDDRDDDLTADRTAQGSLRQAIQNANAIPGAPTLDLPAGTYNLALAGVGEDAATVGDLDITEELTLRGIDSTPTIVDGGGLDRVFHLDGPVLVTMSGFMIRNGSIDAEGGCVLAAGSTSITLTEVTITGCDAGSKKGGALKTSSGSATLTNVTLSGSSAAEGGGFLTQSGPMIFTNVTITANTVTDAGKASGVVAGSGTPTYTNTIVAGNTAGASQCDKDIGPGSNNLDDDGSCGFGVTADPRLGPLQNNGGPTQTHGLLLGSPAIDTGTNSGCPATDQRGVARPFDGDNDATATCDIGAYELNPLVTIDLQVDKTTTVSSAAPGSTIPYTIVVTNLGPADAFAITVTDTFDPAVFDVPAVSWSCSITTGSGNCPGPGTGDINTAVDLDAGSEATFTVSAPTLGAASGIVTNTAAVGVPVGGTDPDMTNNTSTDDTPTLGVQQAISGKVREDVNGNAVIEAGDDGVQNVTVVLFRDDGNGIPDAVDPLGPTTTTDVSGDFSFTVTDGFTYWVVVDSKTVPPGAAFNGSYTQDDVWAEQTWGTAGSRCDDGAGAVAELGGAGACYGGQSGTVSDDASAIASAEHVTRATVAGSGVSGLESAFSFNVIAGDLDGDDDPAANRSVQGSLRQFVQNANALAGANGSLFRIQATELVATIDGGGGSVMLIRPGSELPAVVDAFTTVDGSTQTAFTGDTNPAVAETTTGPEVIVDLQGTVAASVLDVRANNTVVDGLGLTGASGLGAHGIEAVSVTGGDFRNNTIFSNGALGVYLSTVSASAVTGSVLRNNGVDEDPADGIGLTAGSTSVTISGNQIIANAGYGVDLTATGANDTNSITNNLIKGNGSSPSDQNAGVAIRSGSGNSITSNTITENVGDGIVVTAGDTGNLISQNAIFNNDELGVDLSADDANGGDDPTTNDNLDPDVGGNNRQNFPVISSAIWDGVNTVVQGSLNSIVDGTFDIELFSSTVCNGDSAGTPQADAYGEGEVYRDTVNVTDADSDGDVSFTSTIPVDLSGLQITATATNTANNDSSEFAACVPAGMGWTISGTVYHDADDSGTFDAGEQGIGTVWVKLVQGGSVLQTVQADPDTGAYELTDVVGGSYDVIVDDNNNGADSTPTAPVNWSFGTPATGLLSVAVAGADVTDQDLGLTFDFDLAADCACGYEDGLFTQVAITIDGDMTDWATVFSDGDNNACDATDDTDLDHIVQSTGRNLLRTAVTWDATYFSMWTQRVGQSNNTQNFVYYADTNVDGIQQNGEPVVVAKWQGNTGNVVLELYSYDDLGSGGDPVLDANGFADGYSMPGDLTFVKTLTMPDGSGRGSTTGNTDGTQMEWTIEWSELGVPAGSAIGWHIGSTNSNPGASGLGAQIDDNLGGCGGQCTGSNQFAGVAPGPIGGGPGEIIYAPHTFTNTGNGADLFDFTWSWTGDFAPASVNFYRDLGTVGEYDPGVDLLLTDTDSDTDPDTGNMAPGATFELLVAIELPGPPVAGSTTVTTTATSNFVPGCGGTVTPVSGSVDDPIAAAPQIVKRAFQSDGTPIANGSTLPAGMPVKFVIYFANYGGALSDLSLRDVLDPVFEYQTGTMKVDNTLAAGVVCPAGVCDEAAIFTQVDGSGTAVGDGDAVSAPIDADEASYDGGSRTIDLGDQNNGNNAQLDVAADSVWALVLTIQMQ